MADYPVTLSTELTERLASAFDIEGKIPRVFEALGPIGGRDVLLVDGIGPEGLRERQLTALGARLRVADPADVRAGAIAPSSADTIVSCWSWFRDDLAANLEAAERALRTGGRLLVLHDYGRDEVSGLRAADLPEYTTWSRRDGWFLRTGFRVRVIHCWWTWNELSDATDFLGAAFGDAGRSVASAMKRPRLSYNVAVYHRTKGGDPAS